VDICLEVICAAFEAQASAGVQGWAGRMPHVPGHLLAKRHKLP
jgi:hypothetical protein